jgi:hypothetical protein
MTRFRCVLEFEWLNLMLEDIRPRQNTALPCVDPPNILNGGAFVFTAKDDLEPIVMVLPIPNVMIYVIIALLTESEGAGSDIISIVVVYGRGADMFVLITDIYDHNIGA